MDKHALATRFASLPIEKKKQLLDMLDRQGIRFDRLPIVKRGDAEGSLLSYAQQRQWFLWRMDPASTAHHITGALKLTGVLDVEAVRGCLAGLVERHASLRTVFRADELGQAEQVIHAALRLEVPLLDLSNVPVPQRTTQMLEEARHISRTPFDLTQGPLLRTALIRIAADEHVLVVVMHHIVSDGWSMQLIVDEFAARYQAWMQGGELDLTPLTIDYADYAAWQRNWLEAGEKQRQLAYWRGQLGEQQPVLQLTADHARPSVADYRVASHEFNLPHTLSASLKRSAQAHGATLFMALLAGWQALLHRYTGQQDIRIGVPVANRQRTEVEGVVGLFVNTQVMCNRITSRMPLMQVLEQARETVLGAQAHQDLPFEQLVEALQPERNLSVSPLFQVMYNHQREDYRALARLPGIDIAPYALGEQAAQFELTLDTVERQDGGVGVRLTYAAELFDVATMERLGRHYLVLLEQLAVAPQQAVADVALLSEDEQRQLHYWGGCLLPSPADGRGAGGRSREFGQHVARLRGGLRLQAEVRTASEGARKSGFAESLSQIDNVSGRDSHSWHAPSPPTSLPPAGERSNQFVHHLIERQAAQTPDAIALIFGDTQLTYDTFNRKANLLAHRLIALSVQPETKVGIAVERSIDMVVGLLAILKAGGAYVPLDPDYPPERLAYMAQDSGIGLLLTQTHLADRLPRLPNVPICELDRVALQSKHTLHNPAIDIHAENLAYVIYTSGSTGKPKGVAVTHGPLAMHVRTIGMAYGMQPSDRELQFASINFDGAHERIWVPLAFGAALMPRDNEIWTAERTCAEIRRHGITIVCLTPSYLHQFAERIGSAGRQLPIRSYTVGGEAMPRASFDFVQQVLQPPRIINGYGPTETVITPMISVADAATRFEAAYMPIGRLVGERCCFVLDADLNLLPQGVAGELWLGGLGLARGYLNRGGLTAACFIANPFSNCGERLCRTGDLVRWRPDGQLDYLGRVDHQVKIRGFRIELGEIETRLLAIPGIKGAAVIAQENGNGARLIAYVAAEQAERPDPMYIKQCLSQHLPDYMVPAAIVVLDSLPLNANGKVDRAALPSPLPAATECYIAPQGESEQVLAAIWVEALGVRQVGRLDNFFELGGHSLLALHIAGLLEQRHGLQLPVRRFFDKPVLCEMAADIQSALTAGQDAKAERLADMDSLLNEFEA